MSDVVLDPLEAWNRLWNLLRMLLLDVLIFTLPTVCLTLSLFELLLVLKLAHPLLLTSRELLRRGDRLDLHLHVSDLIFNKLGLIE